MSLSFVAVMRDWDFLVHRADGEVFFYGAPFEGVGFLAAVLLRCRRG